MAESNKKTTWADVALAMVNGFFNLLKIEKMVCLVVLYLLGRDILFVSKLSGNSDVSKWLIDTDIISNIFANDNSTIFAMGCVIVFLLAIILVILFLVLPIYRKEIDRLSQLRSNLLHEPDENGNVKLKRHKTSKNVKKKERR